VSWSLDDMVAVASGTGAQVRRWGALLRAARVRFCLVECVWEGGPDTGSADHAELWVTPEDADRARESLRKSRRPDELLLW
jgi:hypothetical protein